MNSIAVYVFSAHEQKHTRLVKQTLKSSKVAIFLKQKPVFSLFVDLKPHFERSIHDEVHLDYALEFLLEDIMFTVLPWNQRFQNFDHKVLVNVMIPLVNAMVSMFDPLDFEEFAKGPNEASEEE